MMSSSVGRVRSLEHILMVLLFALIALCLMWEWQVAPLRPGGSWMALKALPLCLLIGGFLNRRLYAYKVASLMVWFYFAEGVMRLWDIAVPSRVCAALEVALSLALFAAVVAVIRLRLRSVVKKS